jgi:predicted esterase
VRPGGSLGAMTRHGALSAAAAVLLALLLAPAGAAKEPKKPSLPKWKKGEQVGAVTIDGKPESFTALVPRGYKTKKKWPAVLLLHGNGGKAASLLRTIKTFAGKRPPLLISLERCDNNQDAVGYAPKYLDALKTQFSLDEDNVYALGFSGGGFRLWDDVVCKADQLPRFRGVVLAGSAKQSFDPPDKPERAPTIVLVGDPKDPNFTKSGPAAVEALTAKGYEVVVKEHASGHSLPPKEMKEVFAWIEATIKASKKKR